MHKRAVVCTMCGGKYFPASLPFHQKSCAKRHGLVLVPCRYCNKEFPKQDLGNHLRVCADAPPQEHTSARGAPDEEPDSGLTNDGRMACPTCGRNFLVDRISKHAEICLRVYNKTRPHYDSYSYRQVEGSRPVFVKGRTSAEKAKRAFEHKKILAELQSVWEAARAARGADDRSEPCLKNEKVRLSVGRVPQPVGRAPQPVGRAPQPVGRAPQPVGRVRQSVGRAPPAAIETPTVTRLASVRGVTAHKIPPSKHESKSHPERNHVGTPSKLRDASRSGSAAVRPKPPPTSRSSGSAFGSSASRLPAQRAAARPKRKTGERFVPQFEVMGGGGGGGGGGPDGKSKFAGSFMPSNDTSLDNPMVSASLIAQYADYQREN